MVKMRNTFYPLQPSDIVWLSKKICSKSRTRKLLALSAMALIKAGKLVFNVKRHRTT